MPPLDTPLLRLGALQRQPEMPRWLEAQWVGNDQEIMVTATGAVPIVVPVLLRWTDDRLQFVRPPTRDERPPIHLGGAWDDEGWGCALPRHLTLARFEAEVWPGLWRGLGHAFLHVWLWEAIRERFGAEARWGRVTTRGDGGVIDGMRFHVGPICVEYEWGKHDGVDFGGEVYARWPRGLSKVECLAMWGRLRAQDAELARRGDFAQALWGRTRFAISLLMEVAERDVEPALRLLSLMLPMLGGA